MLTENLATVAYLGAAILFILHIFIDNIPICFIFGFYADIP